MPGHPDPPNGGDLMRRFVPESPLPALLGISIEEISDGHAVLLMPFHQRHCTMGDTVHGGAISTLIDTSVMVVSWSGADLPDQLRGATVDLSVSFVAASNGQDLQATARVLRRGHRLTCVRVDVTDEDGLVAAGRGTYQVG